MRATPDEGREQLEALRERLSENSDLIIHLFRERAKLAREIGRIKEGIGLPRRIRERELAILESMDGVDDFSKAIISSLFEYSIMNEGTPTASMMSSNARNGTIRLHGERRHLELMAGLIVSGPGVEVYAHGNLPEALSAGLQARGAHIIDGVGDSADITICLTHNGEKCDISILDGEEMEMRLVFPVPHSPRTVRVFAS